MAMKSTVAVTHLGCEKNRVDTEHMLGLLVQAGYGVDTDEEKADYVLVNTCSFIEAARTESVRTLVRLAEMGKKVVISGCLAQHFQTELLTEIPEAVALIGTGDYQNIVQVLERVERGERVTEISQQPSFIADENLPRYRTTTEAMAYLRIAEGCDYRCAFCIIPHLRGDQRSRSIESVVYEAKELAAQGVKEIVLISQITTNYGLDRYGEPRLAELIQALGVVDVPWIRLLYLYPTGLTPKVLQALRASPNVLPYLDMPLQHSHPQVLKRMNRPWQVDFTQQKLAEIRASLPGATLRTTFIVGFPGETQEHFEHLLAFVRAEEFDHVGVFAYSREAGTPAADLPDQVPTKIKQQRRKELMLLQQSISLRRNQQLIGQTLPVLLEQENPATGQWVGRAARFAPDVDGQVWVRPPLGQEAPLNQIVPGRITQAEPYDLQGVLELR
ncbi:30S ribosomal protein S12 methylthiotransferase RimO [Candidatus Cyanaurora vandensis]|uniref:30S ribosomal protein S12 methylthiotransferase RimO n=1 Tax=Candidatus Cyanaurora vandensis TaxID=2714958 RepID=UPI0037BF6125